MSFELQIRRSCNRIQDCAREAQQGGFEKNYQVGDERPCVEVPKRGAHHQYETSVEPAKRFLEYAAAFEQTFADDDWARLEPYFAEDVIYVVTGEAPLGGRWEGRKRLLEHLRDSLNELDRKFDERRVEPTGTPTIGETGTQERLAQNPIQRVASACVPVPSQFAADA